MMDFFVYAIAIVAIILLKLGVIVAIYTCRARRLRALTQQRVIIAHPYPPAGNAYPTSPYNANSAIVNFEELPQPSTLQPNSGVNQPPKYEDVTSPGNRPPAYNAAVANMQKV